MSAILGASAANILNTPVARSAWVLPGTALAPVQDHSTLGRFLASLLRALSTWNV